MPCWRENKFHKSESESEEKIFLILCLMSHLWKIMSWFYSFTFVYKTLETTESIRSIYIAEDSYSKELN